jgi:hypothetical protein
MRKYILTENQVKKILDKIIEEQADNKSINTTSQFNELYKSEGHEYEVIKLDRGSVKVGHDGILGDHNVFIPWSLVINLYKRFKS